MGGLKYLTVACPTCAQQPNEMCVGGQVHASRIEAWEFVEDCEARVAKGVIHISGGQA